jgi:hypothetical protein
MAITISKYGDILWGAPASEALKASKIAHYSRFYRSWITSPYNLAQVRQVVEFAKAHNLVLPFEEQEREQVVNRFYQQRIALSREPALQASILPKVLTPFQQVAALYAALVGQSLIADPEAEDRRMAALGAAYRMRHETILIVCRRTERDVWVRDITRVFPKAVIQEFIGAKSATAGFWMVAYEDLQTRARPDFPKMENKRALLIVDHAEYLKRVGSTITDYGTQAESWRSHWVRKLALRVYDRILLTEMPVNLHTLDLRGLLDVLGTSPMFTALGNWFDQKRQAEDLGRDPSELSTLLRATCMVRRAELPYLEPVFQHIPVRALTVEENLNVTSPLHRLGVSKDRGALEWLRDFLKTAKGKVVVVAHHNRVVEALSEGLGIPAIYGKTSTGTRERFLADFCDPAGSRVLVLSDDVPVPENLPRLWAVVLVELLNSPLEQFALAKYLDGNWYCLVAPDNLDYARWDRMDARLKLVRRVLDGE